MKCKGIITSAIPLIALCSFVTADAEVMTKVNVEQANAIDSYIMRSSGKMYFSGDNLVLDTLGNGNTVSRALSDINKLTFSQVDVTPTGVEKVISKSSQISIYPSPAKDKITIQADLEGEFSYVIFSANGESVMNGKASNGSTLDVSNLQKGVYLLKIETTYIKITKL